MSPITRPAWLTNGTNFGFISSYGKFQPVSRDEKDTIFRFCLLFFSVKVDEIIGLSIKFKRHPCTVFLSPLAALGTA